MEEVRFGSVSLIHQRQHKFYSLTMPSSVLAETCFVINREEDPIKGFQRELDLKRAQEIANYIDNGLGTIPSAIVLSAQEDAEFEYNSKTKTLNFKPIKKAFLIIDGQHRVYGFKLAKTELRVPVVIYDGLSKQEETKLFIDINSKQKGVPAELLLDIKRLAEYENDQEGLLRDIFDLFYKEPKSVLYKRLSPASKKNGTLSRVTFNTATKPLINIFAGKPYDEIYDILNNYLAAFYEAILEKNKLEKQLTNTVVFKAITNFFPTVAVKVKDRYGADYSVDHFVSILAEANQKLNISKIKKPGTAYKPIVEDLEAAIKNKFTL